jgi:hypothetical protein
MGLRHAIAVSMIVLCAAWTGIESHCGEDDANPFGVPGFTTADRHPVMGLDGMYRELQQARAAAEPLAAELATQQAKIALWVDVIKKCDALDDEKKEVQSNKELPRSERETKAYAIEREKSRLLLSVGNLNSDLFSALKDLRAEVTALEQKLRAKQLAAETIQEQIDARGRELKRKVDAERYAVKIEMLKKSKAVVELNAARDIAAASLEAAKKRIAQSEKELADAEAENQKWRSQLESLAKRTDLSENEKKVKGYLEAYAVQWPPQKDSLQKNVAAARQDYDAKNGDAQRTQIKIDALLAELQALNAKYPN